MLLSHLFSISYAIYVASFSPPHEVRWRSLSMRQPKHLSLSLQQRSSSFASYAHTPAVESNTSLLSITERSDTAGRADSIDWSFLEAVYVITCSNADENGGRISQTRSTIDGVGISNTVKHVVVKDFKTDDEDRIRGCYKSHISVLRDAYMSFFHTGGDGRNDSRQLILILEDNIALSGKHNLRQSIVDSLPRFVEENTGKCDMIHLAYTPYVPNLTVERTIDPCIVQLKCGAGSALGTSAYIISAKGIKAILEEHSRVGYVAPIPDVMAKLFPNTRYASFPTPFQRAPKTKSLVNPQLDDLRSVMFQPLVVAQTQNLLAYSGLSTNVLLPMVVLALFIVSSVSGRVTIGAMSEFITTGSYHGNVIIPFFSSIFSLLSLGTLIVGAALAPKQPDPSPEDKIKGTSDIKREEELTAAEIVSEVAANKTFA